MLKRSINLILEGLHENRKKTKIDTDETWGIYLQDFMVLSYIIYDYKKLD